MHLFNDLFVIFLADFFFFFLVNVNVCYVCLIEVQSIQQAVQSLMYFILFNVIYV